MNTTNQNKLAEIDAQIARTADPIATDRLYKKRDKLVTGKGNAPRELKLVKIPAREYAQLKAATEGCVTRFSDEFKRDANHPQN